MAGLVIDNSTGSLSYDAGSAPVSIRDAHGLTIANADASKSVNFAIDGSNDRLLVTGDLKMATSYTIDLNGGQLLGAVTETFTEATKPAFGSAGRIIYVTDSSFPNSKFQYDTGAAWAALDTQSEFSGNLADTTAGYLYDSTTSTPVTIQDADGLKIAGSGGTNFVTITNPALGTALLTGTLRVSTLTATRVLFAGADKELSDNAGFTFDGTTLTVPATVHKSDTKLSVQNSSGTEGFAIVPLRATTTNSATPTEMSIDNSATLFLPALASGASASYTIYVTGRCTASSGSNVKKQILIKIEALVFNDGGTTAIVDNYMKTIMVKQVTGYDVDITADDTNDRLAVKVTGAVTDTISWRGYATITTI